MSALTEGLLVKEWGDRPCVVDEVGLLTYSEVDALADRVTQQLRALGVRPGDRIGIYARRSADVVAIIVGSLRAGVAYVPTDPNAPPQRNARIHADCGVALSFVEREFGRDYEAQLATFGASPIVACLENVGGGDGLKAWLRASETELRGESPPSGVAEDALAHILYTSGSTGAPKGVTLTHRAIDVFVTWCRQLVQPKLGDRFANHAQFNFGISTFDIFVSLTSGATLVIVPDDVGRHPRSVTELIERERISIWYSTPFILSLIARSEGIEGRDLSSLRLVAFAGEAFPPHSFEELRRRIPHPRYFHMYGSTETNIMAYYEIDAKETFGKSIPVGRTAEFYESITVDSDGKPVDCGEGEFMLRGPGLMAGYWRRPDLTEERFIELADSGERWYRTGDIHAVEGPAHRHFVVGRRDRQVKRGGYRVELGEVESTLRALPGIRDVAVTPFLKDGVVHIRAHIVPLADTRLSVLHLKTACARALPAYMLPDEIEFLAELPRTSTNKIDYQSLVATAEARGE